MLILIGVSCKPTIEPPIVEKKNIAKINGQIFEPTTKKINKTDEGYIITLKNKELELCIILSDTISRTFTFKEKIFWNDRAKAFATIKYEDKLSYSKSGSITISDNINYLSFSVDISLDNSNNITDGVFSEIEIDREAIIDFSTILPTDEIGNIISEGDRTDWHNNKEWGLIEKSLFREDNFFEDTLNNKNLAVYLNPFINFFYISLDKQTDTKFLFFVVNKNFEIVYESPEIVQNITLFNIKDFVKDDEFYRIYYIFKTSDGNIINGHGDIKKENV